MYAVYIRVCLCTLQRLQLACCAYVCSLAMSKKRSLICEFFKVREESRQAVCNSCGAYTV